MFGILIYNIKNLKDLFSKRLANHTLKGERIHRDETRNPENIFIIVNGSFSNLYHNNSGSKERERKDCIM